MSALREALATALRSLVEAGVLPEPPRNDTDPIADAILATEAMQPIAAAVVQRDSLLEAANDACERYGSDGEADAMERLNWACQGVLAAMAAR